MAYVLPGYTVEEIFDTKIFDITTISLSAMRYALHNKCIIWIF